MSWMSWYDGLAKPSWTPPPSIISLIWTTLYPIIFVGFGFVFVQAVRGKHDRRIWAPFALNLVANSLFMPIFAGLRSVELALLDILIVWATIPWCVAVIRPHSLWVAFAQIPYFAWVSTATLLQMNIVAMNWGER